MPLLDRSRPLPWHLVNNLYFDLTGPIAAGTRHDSGRDCSKVQFREIYGVSAIWTDVNALP